MGIVGVFYPHDVDILDFTKTIVQFIKLERIDIGGTKGKLLSAGIANIYEEFKEAVNTFQAVPYDIMSTANPADKKSFDEDFFVFRCSIRSWIDVWPPFWHLVSTISTL